MKPLKIEEIAQATSGTIKTTPSLEVTIENICTDTRVMKPNSLFIALKGDNFDAHDKLAEAQKNGAIAALVHRVPETLPLGLHLIQVDDTRLAMGRLANYVRRQFSRTKVIAVAGSNGKTGTKHLIHSVLKTKFKGSMSPKSFNNDVGLPVTIFAVEPEDDFVVVEVGTNHPGEVRHLSQMCQPDAVVITSIGEEHLEFFKDLDGVRRENAQIVSGLSHTGYSVVNGDDPELRKLLPDAETFGFSELCDLVATNVRTTLDGTSFDYDRARYGLPAIGRHNASNALAAIAIGRWMKVPELDIVEGLKSSTAPDMRMEKKTIGPITLINDAYNANPTSVRAAIATLKEIEWKARKIAVLGEMRELGDTASAAHQQIFELTRNADLDEIYFVGKSYEFVNKSRPGAWLADADAAAIIAEKLLPGDLVLIKASRGIRLEKLESTIMKRFG